jgi:uncharacterized protein (DUF58 family)
LNRQLNDLLKPEVLNTVSGLELVARIIVEGFMSGSNPSKSIGVGYEFSQYRSYEPGDDLRLLDWRMYGRSERYYIKQSEVETNITVKFIVDASRSMDHKEGGLSKLAFAKVMTAALAYLARKQSDTYGLLTASSKQVRTVEPRFEQQQFIRFLNELINAKSEGRWPTDKELEMVHRHAGKEIIIFITDLYDEDKDIIRFVNNLKTSRNEVVLFHLLGRNEAVMGMEGVFTFEDLETGQRVKVDTITQQRAYKKRIDTWLKNTRTWMLEKQIDYQLVYLDQPIESVLFHFLNARKRLVR